MASYDEEESKRKRETGTGTTCGAKDSILPIETAVAAEERDIDIPSTPR